MDETETNKKSENTTETEDAGVQPKANTLVDDTNLAAKRLEEATAEAREERVQWEKSYAKMKLGGGSEAGTQSDEKKFTDEEKASRARIKSVADASGASWGKKYE